MLICTFFNMQKRIILTAVVFCKLNLMGKIFLSIFEGKKITSLFICELSAAYSGYTSQHSLPSRYHYNPIASHTHSLYVIHDVPA